MKIMQTFLAVLTLIVFSSVTGGPVWAGESKEKAGEKCDPPSPGKLREWAADLEKKAAECQEKAKSQTGEKATLCAEMADFKLALAKEKRRMADAMEKGDKKLMEEAKEACMKLHEKEKSMHARWKDSCSAEAGKDGGKCCKDADPAGGKN